MFNTTRFFGTRFWRYAAGSAIVWLLSFTFFSGLADAHVTVKPSQSAPGAWETYSLKVPVEKDINTVKVALKIPEGLAFKQYRPLPEWIVELTTAEDGTVTAVTWTSEGDGIGPGEFQQFEFVAQNPSDDAELAWDAFQYYSDGSVVEWTGAEGDDRPHSLTVVSAAESAGQNDPTAAGHDHSSANTAATADRTEATGPDAATEASAPASSSGSSSAATTAIVLGACALLVALLALGLALRGRRKAA
ncbi:YcnI family protein [Paenibacillus sp. MBLB2552]|uniref:YcnI family protein n=1 Tax=Paenibacillus mellifer TaxID=2937794 RepID=A0A9X2BPY0_9BACL|nr:YcnI family protein [Paenibacillus mellifer]MCK8487367.1 YcnI family protein [Paenibacillus mellifer]